MFMRSVCVSPIKLYQLDVVKKLMTAFLQRKMNNAAIQIIDTILCNGSIYHILHSILLNIMDNQIIWLDPTLAM